MNVLSSSHATKSLEYTTTTTTTTDVTGIKALWTWENFSYSYYTPEENGLTERVRK
jgi:hypothetical protein